MAQSDPRLERRSGQRVIVEGERLRWSPIVPGKGRPPDREAEFASLIDLSKSGAFVVAPFDPRVRVGTHVSIEAAGARGFVQVRRIDPTNEPDRVGYGVEFVHLDAPLRSLVDDVIASCRTQDAAW